MSLSGTRDSFASSGLDGFFHLQNPGVEKGDYRCSVNILLRLEITQPFHLTLKLNLLQ